MRHDAINIIVSDEGNFCEIENDEGKSISIGEWIEAEEGINKVRITLQDMIGLRPDKKGIRVDDLGDRYRILHMGKFTGEGSKEIVLEKNDFDSLYEQMKKIKEPDGFSISK